MHVGEQLGSLEPLAETRESHGRHTARGYREVIRKGRMMMEHGFALTTTCS